MITLDNIRVQRGGKTILDQLSARIKAGDFITIVGANGTGKTTLFDTIAGGVKLDSGTIIVDGHNKTHESQQKRTAWVSRLLQNPSANVVMSMSVMENLALASLRQRPVSLHRALGAVSQETIDTVLALLGKGKDILSVPIGSLSGGQRQAIAFVMATVYPPKLLLLDEPTAALDPQAATALLLFAQKRIAEHKITTLMITHDQLLAKTLGNRLWVLDKGFVKQEFEGVQKQQVATADLIGHIDYAFLQKSCPTNRA